MSTTLAPRPGISSRRTAGLSIGPADPERDAQDLHRWLTDPRSHYWGMQDITLEQTGEYLQSLAEHPEQKSWIGRHDGIPAFYVETYRPALLLRADQFAAQPGDVGMHLLVAPPDGPSIPGFTSAVMREVVDFCFHGDAGPEALRIVVEPDSRNIAILAKNAAAGFRVLGEVELRQGGAIKRAALSLCTREDFAASPLGPGHEEGEDPHRHLHQRPMSRSHRHLVAKAIAEFSHERIIAPQQVADGRWHLKAGGSRYEFTARVLPLEHWVLDEESLVRTRGGVPRDLDVQDLILDLQKDLQIPEDLLSTYLEEISSTLAAGAAKIDDADRGLRPASRELVTADLPTIEAAMTEGHPGFLAGNGRIGYSLSDYREYAPESGRRTRLHWVAARREHSHLSLGAGLTEEDHLRLALSPEERSAFEDRLTRRGLDPAEYHVLPLHPWQAEHRLPITFAADVGRGDLVPLGPGGDEHQPQQSLRTFFNRTRPGAPYVKVALAIQNMGFLRGLSPQYMRDTPIINDWIADLVREDRTFADAGFSVLRERSALGYTGDIYHSTAQTNPHRKMLAALWRENPLPLLGEGERAMTMAALLHRDHEGTALATLMQQASGRPAEDWLAAYLQAYLHPLVHSLLAHDVVFMPHGENLILRVKDHVVAGAFMKDIGEEIAVVGPRSLPQGLERIQGEIDGETKALAIFTDVFDGVLRHLSGIFEVDGVIGSEPFWRVVAGVLDRYEQMHPEHARGLAGDVDLRAGSFDHSCLNRLQLRNTLSMVDITSQADSLLYAGRMENPVARS